MTVQVKLKAEISQLNKKFLAFDGILPDKIYTVEIGDRLNRGNVYCYFDEVEGVKIKGGVNIRLFEVVGGGRKSRIENLNL